MSLHPVDEARQLGFKEGARICAKRLEELACEAECEAKRQTIIGESLRKAAQHARLIANGREDGE